MGHDALSEPSGAAGRAPACYPLSRPGRGRHGDTWRFH